MSLSTQRLSNEVLNSYANTRTFLEGRDTLVQIAKQRDRFVHQPLYFTAQHRNPNRCWRILHILTIPLRFILRAFLVGIGFSLMLGIYLFPCLTSLRLRVNKAARQCKIGFKNFGLTKTTSYTVGPCNKETAPVEPHFARSSIDAPLSDLALPQLPYNLSTPGARTQATLLGWSQNRVSKELTELLSHPPITVTDPRLQKRMFEGDNNRMILEKGGHCRGMSYWFLYLYFQTKHLYADARKHMAELCKIFNDGPSIEAILLQGFNIRNCKIMHLRHKDQDGFYSDKVHDIELTEINGSRQIKDPSLAKKKLANLEVGAYICYFPTHACVYIKISQELSYFYNPNCWLMEVAGPHQAEHLFLSINQAKYLGSKGKGNLSCIVFFPVHLREDAPRIGPGAP